MVCASRCDHQLSRVGSPGPRTQAPSGSVFVVVVVLVPVPVHVPVPVPAGGAIPSTRVTQSFSTPVALLQPRCQAFD